jgi:hypothetical protein
LSVLARETPRTSAVSVAEAKPLRIIALDITSPNNRIPFFFVRMTEFSVPGKLINNI